MTQPPTMISDNALNVASKENISMGIPPLSPIPCLTSPLPNLNSHCRDLFRPVVWHDSTSVVHKPQHWQVASSTHSSKTTKIPLRFCHPTTTTGSSQESSQKDLVLTRLSLLKGWVYAMEEVHTEVKTKVVDPSLYKALDTPLTHAKRWQLGDLSSDLYR
jgi:hypothetical protein